MLDIHYLRLHTEEVRQNLSKRQNSGYIQLFDQLIQDDLDYRKTLQQAESLRAKRNQLTQEVAKVKDNPMQKQTIVQESKNVGQQIIETEKRQKELKEKIHHALMALPNLLLDEVPYGKDENENQEIKKGGTIPAFDFEIQTHGQIAKNVDGVEFERAVKTSGTGFYALKGPLVLLDWALQQYALDILMQDGFIPMQPSLLMNRKAYEGVTDLADFEGMLYKIENEDLHLIATSEHPLTAQFMDEIIPVQKLPIQYAGISPCFRREVGKHGLDERGFFRVHHFNKIEQVVICHPSESRKWHDRMLLNTEKMFQGLEFPYRIVNVCTGDIGIVAAKKYDIDGWSPREKKYFELGSLSNCTSYQAVRLNIKYSNPDGSKDYVHTLNATGIATTRMLRCILENYQTKEGGFRVPKVLQPYMYGLTQIPAIEKP